MQSDQLTTNIPDHLPNSIATGQQDDSDNQDNREEELYQVDGTMDVLTPTDNSDDNEDNEPDNNEHIVIIGYQMILNLMGTLNMKIF